MQDIEFPRAVVRAYTEGDCWFLAGKVHQHAGFPVMALYPLDATAYPDSFVHMGNRTPDGRILDIEGIHKVDDWINAWSDRLNAEPLDLVLMEEEIYYKATDGLALHHPMGYAVNTVIYNMFEQYLPHSMNYLKT